MSESETTTGLKEADWWEYDNKGRILCTLCPRFCHMAEDQAGFCYIRKNIDGKLYSLGYGQSTGFAIDPVEKKPLNHFLPGTGILSFGTAGCNLGCRFCQNWNISKAKLDDKNSMDASPANVVALAMKHKCPSIALTYNDPTIIGEFVMDINKIAKEYGVHLVLVTAGYITPHARKEIYQNVSAANVDLKGFTERFYHKITFSELEPVLDTLKWLKHETDIWFEITNLKIPGENDDIEETKEMCDWILNNLGDEVPLHFTAFHPDFKMMDKERTPAETVNNARKLAMEMGIKYSYVGNVHEVSGQTTYCPSCKTAVIARDWHRVLTYNLKGDSCRNCGTKIAGVFS
jgi:pyruvate formate lyase activating enzyme